MRLVIAVVLVVSGVVLNAAGFQTSGGAAKAPATSACSILTKELLAAHSPASKDTFALIVKIPPQEDKIGAGSSCQYGDTNLQIDPFPVANFEKLFGKWTPVAGVGDRAYFRDNRGEWAELAVVSGARMVTIQMDVPRGGTAATIQPNTVSMAKAVLAQLK